MEISQTQDLYRPNYLVVKKRRKAKLSAEVRTEIRKYVAKLPEWKHYDLAAANNSLTCNIGATAPNNLNLTPIMSQGVAEGQRVGNSITIKKATLDLVVNLINYNSVTNANANLFVRCVILKAKTVNTQGFGNTNYATIFQYNNTDLGEQGNILDTLLRVNRDEFTPFWDKLYQLNYSSAISGSSNGGQGAQAFDSQGAYTTGKIVINLTKMLKKKLTYDGTSTNPSNDNLFIVFFPVAQDGSTLTTTIIPVETHTLITYQYADA